MSTCFLSVTVRAADKEKLLEVLSWPPDDEHETGNCVELIYHEASYGLGSPLYQAAQQGVEFYGWHEAGSDFGSNEFYSGGLDVNYLPTGQDCCGHVITGKTPSERLAQLAVTEKMIAEREALINRMHNHLYDLAKEIEPNV